MPLYLLNDCFVMVKCSLIINKNISVTASVAKWFILFFNLWPFKSLKICPSPIITMVKVGTKPFIELEQYSIMYLQDLIKKHYDLKITFDGCLADVAIKPKIIKEDSWMMIQAKSTYKPTRGYNFKCAKEYKDCIIFCLCDNDKKMWIFDGDTMTIKYKIAIGLNKSKYDDNEVTKDGIITRTWKNFLLKL